MKGNVSFLCFKARSRWAAGLGSGSRRENLLVFLFFFGKPFVMSGILTWIRSSFLHLRSEHPGLEEQVFIRGKDFQHGEPEVVRALKNTFFSIMTVNYIFLKVPWQRNRTKKEKLQRLVSNFGPGLVGNDPLSLYSGNVGHFKVYKWVSHTAVCTVLLLIRKWRKSCCYGATLFLDDKLQGEPKRTGPGWKQLTFGLKHWV